MNLAKTDLRHEIHELADEAFRQCLISGYGDGEYAGQYQIIFEGKPRHFSLTEARAFLLALLGSNRAARAFH